MAGNIINLIQGVGDIWAAPFGTAEPADIGTAPGAGWTDMGYTNGGVRLVYTPTYQELTVDQEVDIVDRRLTKREFNVRTTLAEATLDNFLDIGMSGHGGAITAKAGPPASSELEPTIGTGPETQVTGKAVLFDGFAEGFSSGAHFPRRLIVRKAVNVAAVDVGYEREGQTLIPVDFSCQYVSASIAPWSIDDGE